MIAVHLENGAVAIRTLPVPPRPEGFALLRLLAGGICNTDLELQRGYYGFAGTPGHEFVAEVVEAGTRALIGQRVAGEINLVALDAPRLGQRAAARVPTRHARVRRKSACATSASQLARSVFHEISRAERPSQQERYSQAENASRNCMNVPLTPELELLVESKVKSGRYHSASEVIREALRFLEMRDEVFTLRKDEIRTQIEERLAGGETRRVG